MVLNVLSDLKMGMGVRDLDDVNIGNGGKDRMGKLKTDRGGGRSHVLGYKMLLGGHQKNAYQMND